MSARLLDLGNVSYLRSQTIYHAVAYSTKEASPGTIIILRPSEPYVSIGYHQFLERDVDTGYCAHQGIPVLRREVGGGTVFLDQDQLFFQCIFPVRSVPLRVDRLYEYFLRPAVNTYRRLGVKASYRPVNDIQVNEKKISGTGAGRIGDAAVVVGNILFDFNYQEMSRVLQLSSQRLRHEVLQAMERYVTSLRRELGHCPHWQDVKEILVDEFGKLLGAPLEPGHLAPEELGRVEQLDKKFTDPDHLWAREGRVNEWVKITTDVFVTESEYRAPGGVIRVILRRKLETIDRLLISGDFTFQPKEGLDLLQEELLGKPLQAGPLLEAIQSFYRKRDIQSPGVSPEDMVKAITLKNHETRRFRAWEKRSD